MQQCYAFDRCIGSTKATEGVGFEPTVGFPTLDFESSALNRTQPPFHDEKECRIRLRQKLRRGKR